MDYTEHNPIEGPQQDDKHTRGDDRTCSHLPSDDSERLNLATVIDVPAIQSLLDDFHQLMHITVCILDLEGNVLASAGWQDICLHFHRTHPVTVQYCLESDLQLSADVPPGELKLYKCKNNMWDIATPLMVADQHVGNLYSGQFFFDDEPLDLELFRKQAREHGFAEQEYLAALAAVPRLSRETVNHCMTFLLKLARMISQLSYGNLKLARSLAERDSLFENMLEGYAHCRMLYENGKPQDFIYLDVNGAFETLTGLKDVVGKRVSEVIPGVRESSPELFEIYGRVALTGKPEKFETYVPALDSWFSIAVYSPRKEWFIAVFDNINERKRHEREIERLNGLYATLSELNQTILHVKSREELFQAVCQITVKHAHFNMVWVGLENRETHIVHPVARAGDSAVFLDRVKIYTDERAVGHGPVGTCIREGKPAIFNDFLHDPRTAQWHAGAAFHGLRAAAALPIFFNGEIQGAFSVYASETEVFRDKEVALLEEVAAAIAIALEHMDRETRRQQAEAALRESEAKYRGLFENSMDGAFLTMADGRVTAANPAACAMLGMSEEEIYRAGRVSMIDQSDLNLQQTLAERAKMGKAVAELIFCRKNGTMFFAETSSVILDGGAQAFVLIRDITERKQAEALLLREQGLYKDLVNTIPVGTYRLRMKPADDWQYDNWQSRTESHYSVEMASDRFCEITGISRQDLEASAKSILDRIHPDDLHEFVQRNTDAVASLSPFNWEGRMVLPDRRMIWVHFESVPRLLDNGEVIWTGVVYDISERKRAEDALREREAYIKTILDNLPIGIAVNSVTPSVIFQYMNDNFPAFYRTTREQLANPDAFWSAVYEDPEFREMIQKRVIEDCASGERQKMVWTDIPITRKGAETAFITASNIPLPEQGLVISTIWDVTERKRAEEALRESEQFNREVIAGAHEGVVVYDRDLRYLVWNPFMEDITGLPASALLGKVAFDVFPNLREYKVDQLLQRALAGETVQLSEMHFQIDQTGKSGWCSTVYSPHCDSQGMIIGVIVIVRDITRHKQAEMEKDVLEAQLRQAQKMESVGRLAGGVAHDFNNMLSVILGYSEMALDQLEPSGPLYQDIQEIIQAGRRSAELTRQLLAFARKQEIQPRILDLNEIIAGMLKMLGRLIGEDINLLWKPASKLWPVKMDPAQLDQILANLAVNARDAIAGVGKLTIETNVAELNEEYCQTHVGTAPGRYVMLAVSDSGCGMNAETLSHLFEPFFTTKLQGKGTGLGLATVYGIVRQNNGFIQVYSEAGHGTTFKIYLPAHETAPSITADLVSAPIIQGSETVLLVEDEQSLLGLSRKMLEKLGYSVLATSNPRQALQLVADYPGKIQLLMTDVVMPEMSGRELQERLSAMKPDLKCLFMSGYTADTIAHQGVLEQGVHFLQKPFSIESLASKLREALDSSK